MGPAKILNKARRYCSRAPQSARVWAARLVAEKEFATTSEGRNVLDKVWAEARQAVEGSDAELEMVWTWGLFLEDSAEQRLKIHEVRCIILLLVHA